MGHHPCYASGMSTVHARVEGGHIVVDGKTDLPEGTRLTFGDDVPVAAARMLNAREDDASTLELGRVLAAIAAGLIGQDASVHRVGRAVDDSGISAGPGHASGAQVSAYAPVLCTPKIAERPAFLPPALAGPLGDAS